MGVRLDNKPLQRALSIVCRALTQRDGIQSHVYVRVKGDIAFLTCSSAAFALTTKMPCRADGDMTFTLPARKALEISKRHSDPDIWSINPEDTKLRINVHRSKYVLFGMDPSDYPKPTFLTKEQTVCSLDSAALSETIAAVLPSAGKNDVRAVLNSVLITINKSELRAVATDGHRLSHASRTQTSSSMTDHSFLIPRAIASEIAWLSSSDQTAIIAVVGNAIQVKIGNTFLNAKLLKEVYPDWKKVVPTQFIGEVSIQKDVLTRMLRSASTVVDSAKRGIHLMAAPGRLTIQTPDSSEEQAELTAELADQTGDFEATLNIDYLLDAIGASPSEEICIRFGETLKPSLIFSPGAAQQLSTIIMPLRV